MKIGILTNYIAVSSMMDSGIGQHYRLLADHLCELEHSVHVVVVGPKVDELDKELRQLRPKWTYEVKKSKCPGWLHSLTRKRWPAWLLFQNLIQSYAASQTLQMAAKQHNLEVIETHTYNFPALLYLTKHARPPVLSRVSTTARMVHEISGVHSRLLKFQAFLEHRAITGSDGLVTHSIEHRQILAKQELIAPNRLAILAHGVSDPGTANEAPDHRPDKPVCFLYVGRFESRKGIDILLQAIPQVAKACPTAYFILIGSHQSSEYWSKFQSSNRDLVENRVKALGLVSERDLANWYRKCDILVAPSRYESFGLIFAEAMAYGKPTIGCEVGGIPEVVSQGNTGLLVRPGNSQSLANAMIQLANSPSLRSSMGASGRRRFLDLFSARKMATASVTLYTELIRSRTVS